MAFVGAPPQLRRRNKGSTDALKRRAVAAQAPVSVQAPMEPAEKVLSSASRAAEPAEGFNRRQFLLSAIGAALAGPWFDGGGEELLANAAESATSRAKASAPNFTKVEYALPPLPYPYNALEPHIDAATMKLHHDKHFNTYMEKLNTALMSISGVNDSSETELEALLRGLNKLKDPKLRATVRNNGGGFYNHLLFFSTMRRNGGGEPTGKLAEEINASFGSFAEFKKQFTAAATSQFGSGWAWLYRDKNSKKLEVAGYPNQDSPIMDGHRPLLGCDVWEHAYYLKYNNRRPEYVQAWWNVVNWDAVAERL